MAAPFPTQVLLLHPQRHRHALRGRHQPQVVQAHHDDGAEEAAEEPEGDQEDARGDQGERWAQIIQFKDQDHRLGLKIKIKNKS